MAWMGAAIAGGVGLIGDVMSSSGQAATNAQNMAIAQMQDKFQQQELQQTEAYDTQMSDTAMQRRVTDLEQAGLNPLLAVSAGGASSPTVSAPSGASIPMQNPNQAFAAAGQQATSAVAAYQQAKQVNSNVNAQDAQAAKTRADTAETLAKLPYSGATAAQSLSNLQEQQAQIRFSANKLAQEYNINEDNFGSQFKMLQSNSDFTQAFNELSLKMDQVDLQRAQLGLPGLRNDASFADTWFGRNITPMLDTAKGMMSIGTGFHGLQK